jgi:hypothetical protein
VTIQNKSDYFLCISRSTHDDNFKKNATYRHSTCDVLCLYNVAFFKNWSHVWKGRCTKTSNFLYVFFTREMLVQLVNLEKCLSPLRSWLSPAGTVSAAGAKYLRTGLPTELSQKPNFPTEPNTCRPSRRSQIFADKHLPTEPQELNIWQWSRHRSQICRRSRRSQICHRSRRSQTCHFLVLHVLLFVYFLTIFALLSLSYRQPKIDTILSKLVFCTQPKPNLSFRKFFSQL